MDPVPMERLFDDLFDVEFDNKFSLDYIRSLGCDNIHTYRRLFHSCRRDAGLTKVPMIKLFQLAIVHNNLRRSKLVLTKMGKHNLMTDDWLAVRNFLDKYMVATTKEKKELKFPFVKLTTSFPDFSFFVLCRWKRTMTADSILRRHWMASSSLDETCKIITLAGYTEYWDKRAKKKEDIRRIFDQCQEDQIPLRIKGKLTTSVSFADIEAHIKWEKARRLQRAMRLKQVRDESKKLPKASSSPPSPD